MNSFDNTAKNDPIAISKILNIYIYHHLAKMLEDMLI